MRKSGVPFSRAEVRLLRAMAKLPEYQELRPLLPRVSPWGRARAAVAMKVGSLLCALILAFSP